MNVIIFIIRVLKLLFMHGNYFFLAFIVIMVLATPAAGSITKIVAGAPVYPGEQNLDISSGLQGCRNLDWWAPGADTNAPPQKNVTIIKTLDDSNIAFSYTISPEIYSDYEGNWYCEGQRPLRAVFNITRPRLTVRFWDLDHDQDVTGQVIPRNANITYRIDTNLDAALQLKYRPDATSLDSFYTVSLADPSGTSLQSVYTGSYGKTDTVALLFDKNPVITTSPFYWKDGRLWDRTSKNIQGDDIYPPGTYTVTVTQNLNRMAQRYGGLTSDEKEGLLTSTASVTFAKEETVPSAASTASATITSAASTTTAPAQPVASSLAPTSAPVQPMQTKVPLKTTYSPLPLWPVLMALGILVACAGRRR